MNFGHGVLGDEASKEERNSSFFLNAVYLKCQHELNKVSNCFVILVELDDHLSNQSVVQFYLIQPEDQDDVRRAFLYKIENTLVVFTIVGIMCPEMVAEKQHCVARQYLDPLMKETTDGHCEDTDKPEPQGRENGVVNPIYWE